MHLNEDLEVVPGQVGDLLHGEGQLHLEPNVRTVHGVNQGSSLVPFILYLRHPIMRLE